MSEAVIKRTASLWRHGDFVRLWLAQTISVFGSGFTQLALPLIAARTLHATPAQMGSLNAVQFAPFLLLGLFVGVPATSIRIWKRLFHRHRVKRNGGKIGWRLSRRRIDDLKTKQQVKPADIPQVVQAFFHLGDLVHTRRGFERFPAP